jgi:chromosome segregation ATPase
LKGGENMEDTMAITILKELREFRTENNKRWEENDKRWDENDRRWEENDKRWEENNRRWEENDKRWEENNRRWHENTKSLADVNARIKNLEEGRKKDRREIIEILDTMQKSISEQFTEMREDFNAKFEKIFTLQRLNDIEHEEFKKLLYTHEKRINFQSARLNNLEEWKEQFDMGEFTMV